MGTLKAYGLVAWGGWDWMASFITHYHVLFSATGSSGDRTCGDVVEE